MKRLSLLLLLLSATPSFAQVGVGPHASPAEPPTSPPQDRTFPGAIRLAVDATDTDHKIVRVRERVPVPDSGPVTLLYPQWETASHAPTAEANALAGLTITAGGRPVSWRRDAVNPFAFHVDTPAGAVALDVEFQFLSPTTAGRLSMTPDIVAVPWGGVLLYPAGWYARDIAVRPTLRLPAGFAAATSLAVDGQGSAGDIRYSEVSLETLVDSPTYAGRRSRRIELGEIDGAPIGLTLVADAADALAVPDAYVAKLKALTAEAYAVFGAPHFQHYDFLVSLSDALPSGGGTEHLRSSENNLPPAFFTHPERNLVYQDLIPHEFVHSWNGKFRIPAGLWTPDLNTPSRDDLLWVYEGQTEYWGIVLAARAGLRTRGETLDLLAVKATAALGRKGRSWKSLADSSLDPVFDAGHGVTWPDWQGREAYYVEGVLLWLDVDTLIRERTGGRRSLDDFARAFFGVGGRSEVTRTYTLADLCAALSRVAPLDWRGFFDERLNAHDDRHVLDGLRRGGYALAEAETPTETARQAEADEGGLDLRSSLGLLVAGGGRARRVAWDSPAFRAGVGVGAKLTSVNGAPYSDEALLKSLRSPERPLRLGFTQDGRDRLAMVDSPPPRYPLLRPLGPLRSLDAILTGADRP